VLGFLTGLYPVGFEGRIHYNEDKGILSETTAPEKAQQNRTAERFNRTLMERVHAALLDDRAEEGLCAEALASVVHVLNRSPKVGLDITPLRALTGRCFNVTGFRVWASLAWALKPKTKQRKLEPRTDMCCFVAYTVGGTFYGILEDATTYTFEHRDARREEKPAKAGPSAGRSSAGPQLTMTDDSDNNNEVDGSVGLLDAEGDVWEKHISLLNSESEEDGDRNGLAENNDGAESRSQTDSILLVGQSPSDI